MRDITQIIIHCSDTYEDMPIGAAVIRQWHVDGNGWDDIGYHWVIRRNGVIESGRPVEQAGAHAAGHNANSLGICMVGGKARDGEQPCNFTRHQWTALHHLVKKWKAAYPNAEVIGHNDVSNKTCPTFDAKAWWGES